jgi:hypothetical protein
VFVKILIYTTLIIIVFFGLAIYSIRREERRKADRRQQELPTLPIEQRQRDRRNKSVFSYLAWVMRSLWSRFAR